MNAQVLRGALLIAVLSLLASCGGGGGSAGSSCTPNGNISLFTGSTGTTPLSSITATALQGAAVPPVAVYVAYAKPPVAAVLAGYPPGAVNPLTYGITIALTGPSIADPLAFSMTFDSTHARATYNATWRFVVVDAGSSVVGCQDLPVTFTIN